MRLPQMTTRRWMIWVVIFAVALGLGLRTHKYLWKASRHRSFANQFANGSDAERNEAAFLESYLAAKDGSGRAINLSPRERSRLDRIDERVLRERIPQARGNVRAYSALSLYHTNMA